MNTNKRALLYVETPVLIPIWKEARGVLKDYVWVKATETIEVMQGVRWTYKQKQINDGSPDFSMVDLAEGCYFFGRLKGRKEAMERCK